MDQPDTDTIADTPPAHKARLSRLGRLLRLLGSTLDQGLLPFVVGPPLNTPYYAIPAYTINSLEKNAA